MAHAQIRLLNGDVFTVEGILEEVDKRLSDAAPSGQSRLAWFYKHGSDTAVGINPSHIAALKASEPRPRGLGSRLARDVVRIGSTDEQDAVASGRRPSYV